jgi:5-formyltetrahydrofolate cyclo-ligase
MPKRSIRQKLLKQRRALTGAECRQFSHAAQQLLFATDVYSQASAVALYAPIHNEVLTAALFSSARQSGKKVCYPRVNGESLEFLVVEEEGDLLPGAFGVAEPTGTAIMPLDEISLVMVPGVAFDRSGYRLGYGRGYYDRTFGSTRQAVLAGLAYDFQVVDELPTEDHDVHLDLLVTSSKVLAFEYK